MFRGQTDLLNGKLLTEEQRSRGQEGKLLSVCLRKQRNLFSSAADFCTAFMQDSENNKLTEPNRLENLVIRAWKKSKTDIRTSKNAAFRHAEFSSASQRKILKQVQNDNRRKAAFTLAEVLITLAVIGVVAAMTMPTLIANYREKTTVTAVKKAYSTFSQAYLRVSAENEGLINVVDENLTDKENANRMIQELSKYIKKIKSCDADTDCMSDRYITLHGDYVGIWDNYNNIQTAILSDGMSFWVLSQNRNGEYFGEIGVDINGKKSPNQYGIDFFHFYVYGECIVPDGEQLCDKDVTYFLNGYGCTALLLKNENMDYLK